MAAYHKVILTVGERWRGAVTVFDGNLSFAMLLATFPAAKAVTWLGPSDRFYVELGDVTAPCLVD